MTNAKNTELIQIFDLDGTLTIEFDPKEGDRTGKGFSTYSYWHRIMRNLARDPEAFEERERKWLEMVIATDDIDMIASLIERTKIEIEMLDPCDKNDESIRNQARLITHDFLQNGIVELDAIRYLKYQLTEGVICAISTGGDESGAAGFIDGLVEYGLLTENLASKIFISGTIINWSGMNVEHLNVGPLKLRGLELSFQKPIDTIKKHTQAVFVNEPQHGDRALVEDFCQRGFVKRTIKNGVAILPRNCVFFSNWSEIFDYRDRICDLHARLLNTEK